MVTVTLGLEEDSEITKVLTYNVVKVYTIDISNFQVSGSILTANIYTNDDSYTKSATLTRDGELVPDWTPEWGGSDTTITIYKSGLVAGDIITLTVACESAPAVTDTETCVI